MNRNIAFTLLLTMLALSSLAQPGAPLASFGNNGIIRPDFGNLTGAPTFGHLGNSVLETVDGKMYTISEINGLAYVSRWTSSGALDPGFGNNGYSKGTKVNLPMGYLQPDGKILISGFSSNPPNGFDFTLVRYNNDGTLDASFGVGGKVVTTMMPGQNMDAIQVVAIQSDGKIVAAGSTNGNAGAPAGADVAFARYLANGQLDPSFGTGGKVMFSLSAGNDEIQSVAIDALGRIVGAGVSNAGSSGDIALIRLLPNGQPDNSFDGDGKLVMNIQQGDGLYTLALQPDGRVLAGGYSGNGSFDNGVLIRVDENGLPDASFDNDGILILPTLQATNVANLRLLSDGRICGSGTVLTTATNRDFLLFRLQSNGSPDPNFNSTGRIIIPNTVDENINYGSHQLLLRNDGSLTVIGWEFIGTPASLARTSIEMVRYNANGTPDNSFGNASRVRSFLSQGNVLLSGGIARQPDGKLVVAGRWNKSTTVTADFDFVVARYLSNGAPDPSFGTNGFTVVAMGTGLDLVNALAIQSDGKILVGGNAIVATGNTDFAILRLNSDGTPDNSFDGDGKLFLNFGSTAESIFDLVLYPDGRILAAGTANMGSTGIDLAFARLLPNGLPDNSFDGDGKFTQAVSTGNGADNLNAASLQADGKILFAGSYNNGGAKAFAGRLKTDGGLDNAFNSTGWIALNLGAQNETAIGVLQQPDGKIVVGGNTVGNATAGTLAQMAVVRLNSNGTFDNDFNGTGKNIFLVNGLAALANTLDMQADGKILLGGRAVSTLNNSDLAYARLLKNGQLDPAFGGGTIVIESADGDETLAGTLVWGAEAYAAGYANHPGTIGLVSAFSLGKLDVEGMLQLSSPTVQYSDMVTLTASVKPLPLLSQQPASTVDFYIGSRNMGSASLQWNSSSQRYEGSLTVALSEIGQSTSVAPGNKIVKAVFNAGHAFHIADAEMPILIKAEDAGLVFAGSYFTSTPSAPLSQTVGTTVYLRSTLTDTSDGSRGNIQRAKLRYLLIDNGTITPITTADTDAEGWIGIQPANTNDSTTGIATLIWPVSLQANQASTTLTIGTEIGGASSYYTRNNVGDRVLVTVSRAEEHFITGGGTVIAGNSAGTLPTIEGSTISFGFHSKYHANGKKTRGKGEVIFQSSINGSQRTYQVKIVDIINMGIIETGNNNGNGIISARAHLYDITNSIHGNMVASNIPVEIAVTDNGEPGEEDELSIAIYNNNGSLLTSSNWNGTSTVKKTIASGNIYVKGGFQAASRNAELTANSTIQSLAPYTVFNSAAMQGIRADNLNGATLHLHVYNTAGQLVKEMFLSAGQQFLLNNEWTKGIYMIRINNGKEEKLIRLVKN